MKAGDVVVPKAGKHLISGAGVYSCAVCVSVSPLILVSLGGDMRWSSTISASDFDVWRDATDAEMKIARRRIIK